MAGINPYIPIRSVGSVAQRQVAIQVQAIELLSVASTDYSVNDRLCLINFAIQHFATYFSILIQILQGTLRLWFWGKNEYLKWQ